MNGNEINTSHLTDGNRTIEDIASDKSDAGDEAAFDVQMALDNNIVTTPTVGADTSVFDWTLAMDKGAISN